MAALRRRRKVVTNSGIAATPRPDEIQANIRDQQQGRPRSGRQAVEVPAAELTQLFLPDQFVGSAIAQPSTHRLSGGLAFIF